MVSSGPESFGGLPGMILGLPIPRLYTTWFATSISDQTTATDIVQKMEKGKHKKVTLTTMVGELQKSTKDWGSLGNAILWRARL